MIKNTIYLDNGRDGRNYCSICKQSIPKGIPKLKIFIKITKDYYYSRRKKYKHICGLCLIGLTKNLNKKEMQEIKDDYIQQRVIKKL